ncbi:MAG TPA: fused MFS/spermidine synthase [Candidatus Omnitrophota bacterium]|nr:fused MFS/spermidine synthase [Candidatus Omnitrophota bacterium]
MSGGGRKIRGTLLTCFFISGACGLIYEIAWLRVMGLIFGNTTYATATVLAGFMAGLGIGAFFFGRKIDLGGDPVRFYGLLEGGIGLYACLTPFLWKWIEGIHIGFYRLFEPSFFTASLFKFGLAFIALFIPTFLMGGTLPVISKFFIRDRRETGRSIGLLYALNTAGAILGVFLSGFFLLYALGVWQSVLLTGLFNLLIFLACFVFLRMMPGMNEEGDRERLSGESPAGMPSRPAWISFALLFLFGVSGAASMMYEVGWTRVLAIILGSSVYAFSLMLMTFLVGIAIGSYGFSLVSRHLKVDFMTFVALEMLTALLALIGINFFDVLPYYFVKIYGWSKGTIGIIEFGKFLLCGLVMLPPTICIGALFACFIHVFQRNDSLGKEVGTAYFSNTIGTIFGSALTGFWIIPSIGIQNTLIAASALNAGVGLAVFFFRRENFSFKRLVTAGILLFFVVRSGFAVEPWNRTVIASDAAVKPFDLVRLSQKDFFRKIEGRELLFYKEGASSTVSVNRVRDNVSLSVNGKVDASSNDAFTQFFLGHLPMLLNPRAEEVLIIGLGSGSTAAAVASYPVRRIDCVELEEAVIDAARKFFSDLNRGVLEDPRVRLIVNDGRNYLLVSPDRYDVIISEPSNPWIAGVANLFSYEHYKTMSERLKPGGVVCQWLHAYSMSTEDLRMIIRTFCAVFKDVSLWTSYYPDLMLIGGNEEGREIDFNYFRRAFDEFGVKKDFAPYGIPAPEGVFSGFWLDDFSLRRLGEGARLNRDNFPYLEFSAPKYLYQNTLRPNFLFLESGRRLVFPNIVGLEPPIPQNEHFYNEIARGYTAKRMYQDARSALNVSEVIAPENAGYLEASGILDYEEGNDEEAATVLSKAVLSNSESAEAHYYLGLTFRRREIFPNALAEMGAAVRIDPENSVYLSGLADTLYDARQYAPALKIYDQVLALRKNDFHALSRMVDIAVQMGDIPQRLVMLNLLINRYPHEKQGYMQLGHVFEKGGLPAQAAQIYEAMAKQFPEDPFPQVHLASVYETLGRKTDARKAAKKAVRLDASLRKDPEIKKSLHG